MADDVEFGRVVDTTLGDLSGTSLAADAAAGATTLTVEYAGDFETSGSLYLNGVVIPYDGVDISDAETDPDTITLVSPLAVAASQDDRVGLMAGGVPVLDWLLHVDLGDGDPVDIPIPFEQRAMWSSVDVETNPVPVVLSADLEALVEVPARSPVLSQQFIDAPAFFVRLATDQSIPDNGSLVLLTAWEGEDGTTDNGGSPDGAPSGGGGWYKSNRSVFRWSAS